MPVSRFISITYIIKYYQNIHNKNLPGVLVENLIGISFLYFPSQALYFARRLTLKAKLLDSKRFPS